MAYQSTPRAPTARKQSKVYGKKEVSTRIDNRWWLSDDKDVYNDVFVLINKLDAEQSLRTRLNIRNYKLYQNFAQRGFVTGLNTTIQSSFHTNRITLNVVKSIVDTVASKINQIRPRADFLTIGGDYKLQKKAKNLTKFMDAIFDDLNVYEVAQMAGIDAEVFGTGIIKVFEDGDKLGIERVIPFELIVDELEAIYKKPRQIHQRRYVSRDVMASMFPEFEKEIYDVVSTDISGGQGSKNNSDTITVVESWHLPSGEKAKDGKHAITIRNCTLLVEEYDKDHFPFVFIRWTDGLLGFWGTGIPDDIVGIQIEINKLLQLIQIAQELMCNPRVLVDAQAVLNVAHINDAIGAIIKYTGTKPEFVTPHAVSPEIYAHLDRLEQKAYNIAGVSQLSAQQEKPAGVEAAIAFRTLQDIESERFQLYQQRYERFHMDIAKRFVDAARDLDEAGVKLSVKGKNKNSVENMKWKDVNLEDDKFSLQLYPTNLLPTTPAGKLDTIQSMAQAGLLTPDEAKMLLDFPDLDAVQTLDNAAIEDIKYTIEQLSDGNYIPPEPYGNLQLGIKMVQLAYLNAKMNGYPDNILDLFRTYIDDTNTLITVATQPPPSPTDQGAAGASAPGAGTPVPVEPPGQPPMARADRLPRQPLIPGGGLS